jgi:transposase
MPRGYSRDLRERLLTLLESGLSVAEVARRTRVSESSLWRWRAKAATGQSLEPGHSPGGPRKIGPDEEDALRAQVAATPDATLAEHCTAWATSGHEDVSVSTMDRTLVRLGLPLKKRP